MRIEAVRGDIAAQDVDAIVNAANETLLGGGGVDGALHRAAGPGLLEECRSVRRSRHPDGLPVGDAVATGAGDLTARWVIHTVGPRWWEHAEGGVDLLVSCHRRSLEVAAAVGAVSVAFPAISCGAFGWRPEDAAPVAVGAVRAFDHEHPGAVETVRFVLYGEAAHEAFAAACSALE